MATRQLTQVYLDASQKEALQERAHAKGAKVAEEIRSEWEADNIFEKSVSTREGNPPYVFFEGPPSANGLPS